ncbi:MAG: hypothetical protein B7Z53_03475 [Rhodospirillales bacterium 12-71-4]|nr:MAG: hypothetical protein B7Z53_03475 [Rhodospirillales bacterium 12-71-4]
MGGGATQLLACRAEGFCPVSAAADGRRAGRRGGVNPAGATRRALLALAIPGCAAAQPPLVTPPAAPGGGLHARAAAKGLAFGAALATRHLAEADLMAAFRADCGLLVAEYEMKWAELEPQAGNRRWRRADQLVDFARRNRMALRGHTLVWHESEPRWGRTISRRPSTSPMRRTPRPGWPTMISALNMPPPGRAAGASASSRCCGRCAPPACRCMCWACRRICMPGSPSRPRNGGPSWPMSRRWA